MLPKEKIGKEALRTLPGQEVQRKQQHPQPWLNRERQPRCRQALATRQSSPVPAGHHRHSLDLNASWLPPEEARQMRDLLFLGIFLKAFLKFKD